jgi:hypothetical protein
MGSWFGEIVYERLIRRSIISGHRPIGAELERMVVIEGLFMEVVSIVMQHPFNPRYPVVKDEFQFRLLNFTHKFLNDFEEVFWPRGPLSCHCRLHVPEKPKFRRC